MKRIIVLSVLIFLAVAAWRIGGRLSADAIGMALGVLFGVLAGLPVALLVLASNRRRERQDDDERSGGYPGQQGRQRALPPGYGYPMPMQQPPVIVVAGPPNGMPQGNANGYGYHQAHSSPHHMLPGPSGMDQGMPQERRYKVVGETEEWIEEY